MKRVSIFYSLMIFLLIFAACTKDDGTEYYSVLGIVDKRNDSTYIVSDEDERLLVNNASALTNVDDSSRIIAYFTLSEQAKPAGTDYLIDIYNYTEVLFKPVVVLTSEIEDSIGNDPVHIRDLWIAKDYLNINFEYYAFSNSIVHYINMIRHPGEVPTDTIELELRHNNNDDLENYRLSGFVSFDLSSLRNPGDSVILHITARDYFGEQYEKDLTYKF